MMRYHIFLIEDDVYFDFFYKTELLNEFFTAYMVEPNRVDLKNQFAYITCPVPHQDLALSDHNIYVSERIITIFTDQELILDNHFMSQLDKIDRHCFIINHTNNNYGWLKPNKNELHWQKQINPSELKQLINY